MTGMNIPFADGEEIIEIADAFGFQTSVNFQFAPLNGIPMNSRQDSQTPTFLITGRVMYHHPTKSGLFASVLTFGYNIFLETLKSWATKVTKNTVNPFPIANIHDFGLAEAWVSELV